MAEPNWIDQMKWIQSQRDRRKQNKQQEAQQQIQNEARNEAKPSTMKRVLHAVRNEDRKRRLGGLY